LRQRCLRSKPAAPANIWRGRCNQYALRGEKAPPWLLDLLKRKSLKLAAVALANKTARIAWKMMLTGETYTAKTAAALAGAV